MDAPIDVVIAWSRRGELDAVLASSSLAALQRWLAWLAPTHHVAHAPVAAPDDEQRARRDHRRRGVSARRGAHAAGARGRDPILEAAQRGADLTRNLLGFSRRGQYRRERLAVENVIEPLVALLARTLPKGVRVDAEQVGGVEVFNGDASLISHALVNLAINASDAMDGQGVLTIATEMVTCDEARAARLDLAPGSYVVISVRDTGTGMDDATRARIFEPFFTTKEAGRGTGLGLAMVYGTMKRHEGAVEVSSELGRGTTMRLYFPAATTARMPAVERAESRSLAPLVGRRILVVDDEPLVRSVVKRVLDATGYQVMLAEDGLAGLEVLERERGAFDLVLLDMAMPRLDGPGMFVRARSRFPALRVLLTGFTSPEASRPLLEGGALGLIAKPIRPAQLVEAVSYAIRGLEVRDVR